jgi:hypothetical protein
MSTNTRGFTLGIQHDPRAVARAMNGILLNGGRSVLAKGPYDGPKERSLRVTFNPDVYGGFSVTSYAGDNWRVCKAFALEKLGLPQWRPQGKAPEIDPAIQRMMERSRRAEAEKRKAEAEADDARRKEWALRIWNEASDPRGTIVERYLNEHRKLELPDEVAGEVIRFHAALKHGEARCPAMVALFRNIRSGEPQAIHRVFLDPTTAAKIDRLMLGPVGGAAIMIDQSTTALTIAEGIETSLAARQLGLSPVWALGSCGAIKAFPAIKQLSELSICEELDNAGRSAAEECKARYLRAGKPVTMITSKVGSDLNDAWRAMK